MKLARRGFLKILCAVPFMTWALPEKKAKEDLGEVLLIPEELEPKARELMSSYFLGPME
ncbi:hypothetical protein ES703_26372 [subsurface metagenome]